MRNLKKYQINMEEALSQLLHGDGLRKLAHRYGCSHTYISQLLQERFGKSITSPYVTSLARSLISDYRGSAEAYQYALSVVNTGSEGEKFKSKSALDAATKWITLDEPELLNCIASYNDDPLEYLEDASRVWQFLRWYYLNFSLNLIVAELGSLYYRELGEKLVLGLLSHGHTKES